MKITQRQLRQIIREELNRTIRESTVNLAALIKQAADYAIDKSHFNKAEIDSYNELVDVVNAFLEYITEFEEQNGGSSWFDFDSSEREAPFWGLQLARDVAVDITGRDFMIESHYLRLAFEEMKRDLEANPPYDTTKDLDAMELEDMFGPTAYRREQMIRRGELPDRR